jgi:alpha-tubulin suppressor-like RCC1 family protein
VQFVSIHGSVWHTCALAADGTAYCWGGNDNGELGDGTTTEKLTPVKVEAPAGVRFVSLTSRCGQAEDGTVYCWGFNSNGQLGDGTTTDRLTPTAVTMPAGVSFVSHYRGGSHTCALDLAGNAYCWGSNNFGQLGDGSTAQRTLPTAVAAPPGVSFVLLAAGSQFTCGLTPTDEAYCWGDNFNGQLGDGTTTEHRTPNRVAGWPNSP